MKNPSLANSNPQNGANGLAKRKLASPKFARTSSSPASKTKFQPNLHKK